MKCVDNEQFIKNQEESFFNNIQGIFIFVENKKKTFKLNGNNKGILGINKSEILMNRYEIEKIIEAEYKDTFISLLNGTEQEKINVEIGIKNKKNESKIILLQGKRFLTQENVFIFEGYISEVNKDSENTKKNIGINNLDSVTGLQRKQYMRRRINMHLENGWQTDNKCAFVIIAIDNFKYINDSFGYKCGDEFLYVVANELNKVVESKYLCKLEGDEFLVILNDIKSFQDAEKKVKDLIKIFNKSYYIESNQIFVTTSIGVSIYPDDGETFEVLLKKADAAMYVGKINGKNQYQIFNSNMSKELDRLYAVQKGLYTALEKNEMFVVFQPKVMLEGEIVNGFEALLRWESKELGSVSPTEFIPMAELNELIVPIGKFVLKEVFIRAKQLLEEGYENFKIAFNLSEVQLREGSIVEYFEQLSKEYNVSGKYIEIEITESMIIKSFKRNVNYFHRFKDMGSTIALDDFGTGYSSLNYLTKLPIDVLKIDRTFVIDMIENYKSRWVIENIIELSHKLGIEVVAEGVEVEEQVNYLKDILCDVVQGYYYSKPEDFDTAMKMLIK